MRDRGDIEIRSFRVVFELDRRLHRIDRWRLPLPYGLPLRSLGYALAAFLAVVAAAQLPALGDLIAGLPVPVRFVLIPCAIAYGLTGIRVDGRSAHEAGLALVAFALEPPVLTRWQRGAEPGAVVRFADVTFAPDGTGSRLPRGAVKGPATAIVRYPTQLRPGRRTLTLRQATNDPLDPGCRIAFDMGKRLLIR